MLSLHGWPSLALVVLVANVNPSAAFWRLPCNNPLIVESADPIVSPGKVSGHVHTISGGSNFSPSSDFAALRQSECTSCLVKQDKSAYWTPQLYFQWANGSFTSVDQVGGSLIYYLPRANGADKTGVMAFPDGLRMVTGNPFQRSYNSSSLEAQAMGFSCLGNGQPRSPNLPSTNCPDGLRGEIRFPSCWDGVNLDSSDHASHMAYPADNENGACPTTHPVRIITLFYEIMYSVDPMYSLWSKAMNPAQPFVFAMGDPTGYGFHGDFMNGWDKTVLQNAIDTCTSDSGNIQDCAVFDLYDQNTDGTCRKTPDVNQIALGTLDKLPGCNPVTHGPENATPCADTATPAMFSSPSVYTGQAPAPGSQVLANAPTIVKTYNEWTYKSCYSDKESVRALPQGLSNPNKTVEGCLYACAVTGNLICGIEYGGECWTGAALDASSVAIDYGMCYMPCTGNSLQYCGGPNALDVYTRTSRPGKRCVGERDVTGHAKMSKRRNIRKQLS